MLSRLLTGFFWIFSTKLGRFILAIIITPILVRVLGPTNYGNYAFALAIYTILGRLVNAGINDGVRKFVAEDQAENKWAEKVVGFYIRLGTILAIITVLLVSLLNLFGVTEYLVGKEFINYLYLIAFIIFIRQYFLISRSALMGKGLEKLSEPVRVVQRLVFGIAGIGLALLGLSVSGVLYGHLIAMFVALIITSLFIVREFDVAAIFSPLPSDFPKRKLASFNNYSVILLTLTVSLYHVDVLMLKLLVGSNATGYYKASLTVAEFLWFVPVILQTALLHSVSELWSNGEIEKITNTASKVTRFTILLTILLGIGIAVLSKPFVLLYFGEDFKPAIVPLLLLLPGALSFAIARPIYSIGQSKGEIRSLILATGAAAVLNFVLNFVLIQTFGIIGAAIATSIGYSSMLLFHGLVSKRIGFNPFKDLRLTSIVTTGVISAIVIISLSFLINSNIVSLIVIPPVGLFVYSIISIKSGSITTDEIQPFATRLPDQIESLLMKTAHYIE